MRNPNARRGGGLVALGFARASHAVVRGRPGFRPQPAQICRLTKYPGTEAWWVSDPEGPDISGGSGRRLDELTRYGLWIGDPDPAGGSGALYTYDLWRSTVNSGSSPFDITWRVVTSARDTSDDYDDPCTVQSSSGYYDYTDGSTTVPLRFGAASDAPQVVCSGGPCPSSPELNTVYEPVFTSPGTCGGDNPSFISPTTGPPSQIVTVAPGRSSQMKLWAFPTTATFDVSHPAVTGVDGGTILGRVVSRTPAAAASGAMLNAVLPIVDPSGNGVTPNPTQLSQRSGGLDVTTDVNPDSTDSSKDYVVEAMWRDTSASTVGDPSHFWETTGQVGVFVYGGGTTPDLYAAGLVDGSQLIYRGVAIIDVTDGGSPATVKDADVSLTYGDNVAFGTIRTSGTTLVVVHVPSSSIYGGTPTVEWSGPVVSGVTTFTWNGTARNEALKVTGDGDFRIKFSSPSGARVVSSCAL